MTLKIELPDSLIEQFQKQNISDEELRAVAVAALEIWLAQRDSANSGRFAQSAVEFTRRLIAENRGLFEALAQR